MNYYTSSIAFQKFPPTATYSATHTLIEAHPPPNKSDNTYNVNQINENKINNGIMGTSIMGTSIMVK